MFSISYVTFFLLGPGARSTPTPGEGSVGPIPHSPIAEELHCGSEMDDKSDAPTNMSTTSVELPGSQPPLMDFNIEDFLKMDSIPELLTVRLFTIQNLYSAVKVLN